MDGCKRTFCWRNIMYKLVFQNTEQLLHNHFRKNIMCKLEFSGVPIRITAGTFVSLLVLSVKTSCQK